MVTFKSITTVQLIRLAKGTKGSKGKHIAIQCLRLCSTVAH